MYILFPGAAVWPIYSRTPLLNQYELKDGWQPPRYWLGSRTRTVRSVTIKLSFNPHDRSACDIDIVPRPIGKVIRSLPNSEFLRIGFLDNLYLDERGNRAVGFVYDVRSVKYAVSNSNTRNPI